MAEVAASLGIYPRDAELLREIDRLKAELAAIKAVLNRFQISAEHLAAGKPLPEVVREWVEAAERGAEQMGLVMNHDFNWAEKAEAELAARGRELDAAQALIRLLKTGVSRSEGYFAILQTVVPDIHRAAIDAALSAG